MSYDVVVIGLGAHGSSTLYYLSQNYPSLSILGIEKHTPGHQLGSSGGLSRIIRKSYFESPVYVQLLERAYDLYRGIEENAKNLQISYDQHPQSSQFTSGYGLLHITGGLDIGPKDSTIVEGALAACKENNLPYELLSSTDITQRWKITLPGDDYYAIYQKDGGFLEPEKVNYTMVTIAQKSTNTTIHYETVVIDVEQDQNTGLFIIYMLPTNLYQHNCDITTVKNDSNIIIVKSKKIVLGTGPWIQDTMKWSIFIQQERTLDTKDGQMWLKLDKFFNTTQTQVQRQVVNWHNIIPNDDNTTPYDSPNFPIFLIHHRQTNITNDNTTSSTTPTPQEQQQEQYHITNNPNDKGLSSASKNNMKYDANGNMIVDPSNTNSINDENATDHFYYGFPSMRPGDNTMKIGRYHHLHENNVHQDELNRNISYLDILATAHCAKYFFPQVQLPLWYEQASQYVQKHSPLNEKIQIEKLLQKTTENDFSMDTTTTNTILSKTCTFTNTFDGHFLIQPLQIGQTVSIQQQQTTTTTTPTDNSNTQLQSSQIIQSNPNVLCLSCCSGHGFKFNSVIGEIAANLIITGQSTFDLDWLGVARVPL